MGQDEPQHEARWGKVGQDEEEDTRWDIMTFKVRKDGARQASR